MRLTIVGCAGSFAGPSSPASCYLVQAEHEGRTWNLVLDLGSGALGALHRHIDPMAIDAVVLSHLHSDHCLDLCGLYVMQKYCPTNASPTRIPVYGPRRTGERMAGAYDLTRPESMDKEFDFRELADRETVRIGPFSVTPHLVNHPGEAYGIRVEADGEVLAYTGDTDSCDALKALCHNATLVLADSAFVDGRDEAQGIHLSGSRAAQAAVDAGGVQRLMLTHMPSWNTPAECRAQAAGVWPGHVELAEPDAVHDL
ncbi:MAG: MBL fold metallo-hydrolase [Chloroflexota bacterium]|nr:MBL fold metallo-hydrolase [Chloroflexota bacterium]